jgi:hypothetical protein
MAQDAGGDLVSALTRGTRVYGEAGVFYADRDAYGTVLNLVAPDCVQVQLNGDDRAVVPVSTVKVAASCHYCHRVIVEDDGRWVDLEASGDDSIWRETCDGHDTFTAEHEPEDVLG